tara:strand:+ start:616 stop:1569 length:954 start_codon:yes stop_codon:yes gene_type:complete
MKFDNRLYLIIIATIILYITFLIISDLNTIYNEILKINLSYLPVILILGPISWFILFLRWHLLLQNSNINIPVKDNFKIFLVGYAMSATPGKIGELIKVQLLNSKYTIPKKNSAPIVIAEQFYNLLGILFIAIMGIFYFEFSIYAVISIGIGSSLIFGLINSKKFFEKTINLLSTKKIFKKYTESLIESHVVLKNSIKGKIFVTSSVLSISFWLIESLIAYLILQSFGVFDIEFLTLSATYTTSIIIGVISFLPMGVGVVEGSLAGFLSFHGIEISLALTLVIFIRIFTRWYGVTVGLITMKFIGAFSLNNSVKKSS